MRLAKEKPRIRGSGLRCAAVGFEAWTMISEAAILAALDKPRNLYAIQQRVVPGQRDTDELQMVLMRLRDEKKVKFDINSGRWSKA